jgi:exodeoxyribonuclease VIII
MIESNFTGYVHNQSFDEYLSHPAISSHKCIQILESPALYKWEKENHVEQTEDMRLGTILHSAILEPEDFSMRVVHMPKFDRRTNKGKADYEAWKAELPEKAIVVNEKERETLLRMLDSCRQHPAAYQLLQGSVKERSSYFYDESMGLQLKGRLDIDHERAGIIADVKKVRSAKKARFQRDIAEYRYHVQAAFYMNLANSLSERLGRGVRYMDFAWILCECEPPYETAVYYATEDLLRTGLAEVGEALKAYQRCTMTGNWASYPTDPQPIELPKWYVS